jgi:hypothetical protein
MILANSSGDVVLFDGLIVVSSDSRAAIVDVARITVVACWKGFAVCTPWFNWGWRRGS